MVTISFSISLLVNLVLRVNYDTTVFIKSLKETEGVSERAWIWQNKFDNQRFTIWFSTDSSGHERSDRDITRTDRSLLIDSEMRRTRTAFSSREWQRIVWESAGNYGGHDCSYGLDKNHCRYHEINDLI